MSVLRKHYSAATAQPNTPETDAMPEVPHIVYWWEDQTEHQQTIMATDPMDAIHRMRQRHAYEGTVTGTTVGGSRKPHG